MIELENNSDIKLNIRYSTDCNVEFFFNFIYGKTFNYKDQLRKIGFKFSQSSREFYRIFVDEKKEKEFLDQLKNELNIDYRLSNKEKIKEIMTSLNNFIKEKYSMTLAYSNSSFCKTNIQINFFLLMKYFQINPLRKCFMPIPNRFPSKIFVDHKIEKEILSFDEFLDYNPFLITNDSRIYLHLEIMKDFLKNSYVITSSSKVLLDFITANFIVLAENIPQFYVTSFKKLSQVFLFANPVQKESQKE